MSAALIAAPSAAADSEEFVDFLQANGENVSTRDISYAVIDLGQAICNHLDATQDPNATVDYMVSLGHSNENANMWLAGSVMYLCPDLNYLTGYN